MMKILLIEDSPGDIRLIQEALNETSISHDLFIVRDGAEALDFLYKRGEYAEASRPHIILLDLNLPKMDGREVLEKLKSDPNLHRIPIVVLTTSRAEEDIIQSYDLHANCYITKPADPEDFFKVVQAIKNYWLEIVHLPKNGHALL